MNRRNHSRQAKSHEHSSTNWSKLRCRKFIPKRRHNREETKNSYDSQIDNLRLVVTIEAIIKPRDKGTHDKHRNATVIQSKTNEIVRKIINFSPKFISYLLNSFPTTSEWHETVWKVKEKPRQRIAPMKNALKIIFSSQLTSHDGRNRKYAAVPMNMMQPSKWVLEWF